MALNTVSKKLRSLARRWTTFCKPSVSRRPRRPNTFSRKLDLGTGIKLWALEPLFLFEIPPDCHGGYHGERRGRRIPVRPFQFGHVLEIHSIPGPDQEQR